MPNRRRSIAAALVLGLFVCLGVARSISAHNTGALVLALALGGVPAAFFVRWAARRQPALVIADDGLTDGRSGRFVPWSSVTAVRVGIHQGMFGESHHLVVTVAHSGPPPPRRLITTNATNPHEIDLNLDWLSRPWRDVVALIEQAFGPVAAIHERGFRSI